MQVSKSFLSPITIRDSGIVLTKGTYLKKGPLVSRYFCKAVRVLHCLRSDLFTALVKGTDEAGEFVLTEGEERVAPELS